MHKALPGLIRAGLALCISLLLASSRPAVAADNDWLARIWRTDNGLLDNSISGLAQTPEGYLWVGTDGGLMRFDGARFQEFSLISLQGVANRVIRTQVLDHRGRLWLGMDRGTVVCVEPDRARVFSARDGLPDLRATVMAEDGDGAIWIAYSGALGVSRIKDGQVTRFSVQDGLPPAGTCWLASDAKGQLWFAKGGFVGVFREGRFQTLQTLDTVTMRITAAHSGGIWICDASRLLKYDEGRGLPETVKMAQPGATPTVLLEDRAGVLWIGTSAHGLFRYDGSTFETVTTSHPEITCLVEDRENNIWVGTRGGGLNQLQPRTLELLNTGFGQPFESIRSLCEDATGSLWVTTQNGLLVHQQGTEWVTVSATTNWPGGDATCVAADPRGPVWIGTRDGGLYRCQSNHFNVWSGWDGLAGESVRSLLVSSAGDLWIGTDSPRRLQRLHNGEFHNFDLPTQTRSIRAMAEDIAGNIWAGTAEGQLFRIKGDVLVNETFSLMHRPLSIRCLLATPDGSLWIGHAKWGLGRIKDGRYARITTQQGLNDDYISHILPDARGWLWFAGDHGLFRVRSDKLTAVAEGRETHVRSIVYGSAEGLPSLQANYDNFPGALRGHDGRLRFPMRTGLLVVHTENMQDNPDPPPVLLERVAVDGQTVASHDSRSPLRGQNPKVVDLRAENPLLRLLPNHRKVDFEFTALSLTAPENVHFRYRLEGVDEDWIEAGVERHASYSRLAAGAYRFHVIACNNSGIWNETGAALGFAVKPFFWQTWWFRLASIAVFTLLVAAIVRYASFRRLRLKLRFLEQQAAVERERSRIAKDIHDDLGGSLTQVTMLLELALRNRALPEKADGHVQQGLVTARQMIKSLDETVWAVNPRNDTLPHLINYTGQFAVKFMHAANIRCRLDLPDHPPEHPVLADVRHNLFLAVKEALTNVIRHGAHATEVSLIITVTGEFMEITIRDNGQGFQGVSSDSEANGLRNMRQRLEEIGGSCRIESVPGAGTRVSFIYPWPPQERAALRVRAIAVNGHSSAKRTRKHVP